MKLALTLAAALVLPLAACAASGQQASANQDSLFGIGGAQEQNIGPCPLMGVLNDSARVVKFANPMPDPTKATYAQIAWTAEMRGVRGLCRYVGEDPITMNLEIDMAFGRGPAAPSGTHTYRYWVAVTQINRVPIAKQYFDVPVNFGGNPRMAGTETIAEITIPRARANTSGANFEVLVGFDLTPEQLNFNRSGVRFRMDVGGN
jgi:hypothetical protein